MPTHLIKRSIDNRAVVGPYRCFKIGLEVLFLKLDDWAFPTMTLTDTMHLSPSLSYNTRTHDIQTDACARAAISDTLLIATFVKMKLIGSAPECFDRQ